MYRHNRKVKSELFQWAAIGFMVGFGLALVLVTFIVNGQVHENI